MPRRTVLAYRVLFVVAIATITFLALTGEAIPIMREVNDKLQHTAAFFTLGLLLDFAFPDRPFGAGKLGVLLAYGVSLELAQVLTQSRDPSLGDVVADAAGLLIYAGSTPLLRKVPVLERRWAAELVDVGRRQPT
jgi:VanZ family protein